MKNLLRREETRSGILGTAAQCFAENGFAETGVAEICARAGVSKGAFYYHFESKQAVFLELLNHWLAGLEQALEAAAQDAVNIPQRLLELARMMQNLFRPDNKQTGIFLELWTQASRDETVRRASIATYLRYKNIFTELIRRGIREGTLAPVDPVSAAQVIISLASGLFLQSLVDPAGADWGKVTEDSIRILLDGLTRKGNDEK